MNQNIKREWVAALRSGDYEQGTGELKMESDNSKSNYNDNGHDFAEIATLIENNL